ncbi:MAG: hypothetical protein GXO91_03775 [FCB group bacterium]|nr:hypothetical protein [FCB group bacterium]
MCAAVLSGRAVSPTEREKKEVLTIGDKRRTYYQLQDTPLHYQLRGPMKLEIIARKAVPQKISGNNDYAFYLIIDGSDSVYISFSKKKSRSVTSPRHPGHAYTVSGSYLFSIPSGEHVATLAPADRKNNPILVRMLVKATPDIRSGSTFVTPITDQLPDHILVQDKIIRYFKLDGGSSMTLELEGPGRLEVISRLAFEDWMTNEEPYRLRLLRDELEIGTYFFTTEKSEQSAIEEEKSLVPGKWRSFDLELQTGRHQYTLQFLNEGKTVFVRCLKYSIDETKK